MRGTLAERAIIIEHPALGGGQREHAFLEQDAIAPQVAQPQHCVGSFFGGWAVVAAQATIGRLVANQLFDSAIDRIPVGLVGQRNNCLAGGIEPRALQGLTAP